MSSPHHQMNQSMCKQCHINIVLNHTIYFCLSHRNISDVIKSLRRNLKAKEFTFEMVVRRGDILSDALRRMERLAFDPNKPIKVLYNI